MAPPYYRIGSEASTYGLWGIHSDHSSDYKDQQANGCPFSLYTKNTVLNKVLHFFSSKDTNSTGMRGPDLPELRGRYCRAKRIDLGELILSSQKETELPFGGGRFQFSKVPRTPQPAGESCRCLLGAGCKLVLKS